MVGMVQKTGKSLLQANGEFLFVLGKLVPRPDAAIPGRQLRPLGDDPHIQLPLIPLFPDDVPARVKPTPVFIDEIGPLELDGNGFFAGFKKILRTQRDVYITVRNHCVEDVINKFNIRNYTIIMVNEKDEKN